MINKEISGSKTKMRRSIPEYDMLRVILTLLVIIGHSTYYRIMTPYGGCDYTAFTLPDRSALYRLVSMLVTLIYMFHMPLYMALSGALYRVKLSVGGYASYKHLLVDKAKKLLIPFLVVTFIYSVPLKYISGYYSTSDNVISDIFIGQVLIQGNTHLWFLPTLFMIFAVIYLIDKNVKVSRKLVLLVLFIVSFISPIVHIEILMQVMKYLFWFYLGYCFEIIREHRIKKELNLILIFSVCIICFLITALFSEVIPEHPGVAIYSIIERMLSFISTLFGCVSVYVFCFVMSNTSIKETKVFKAIRNNSLGLYLYSDTWNYVLLCIAVELFQNKVFITNLGAFLFCFSRIIMTFTISFIVSMLLKKLNAKYVC